MNPSWRKSYARHRLYFLDVLGRYKERAELRAYLEILLSLATISIFAVFAFRPTLLTIAGLIKDVETKQETLATMDKKIQDLSQAQNLYDQERRKILFLETAIPQSPNVDVFARQIEGLSGKHGVDISRLFVNKAMILGTRKDGSSDEKTKGSFPDGAGEVSFSVGASVSDDQYPLLAGFLSDLEILRRPIKIETLGFTLSTSKAGEQGMLIFVLKGKFPYFLGSDNKLVK